MNFRTTIFLLVLLVAAATVFFITRRLGDGGNDPARTAKTEDAEKKLMSGVNAADVKRVVVVASATGERLAFERAGTSEWRIVEPVRAPADAFKVDDLVREVTELRSRGQVEPGDKGVDAPQYTVELTHGADDKTITVKVGNRSPVGDMLYVRLGDDSRADVVSARIIEQLEKPAADYRKARLLDVTNDQITGVTVARGDKTMRLEKAPDDKWRIVEPEEMPGDDAQVSALLTAVTGLDAVKFVAEDARNAAAYGLAKPTMTVTFTTEPPATQPSTGPAAAEAATRPTTGPSAANTTTIKFGRPDVQKQNVYAMASDAGPIVTIANAELEGLRKTPLDLRDRTVLDLDANAISRMTLSVDRAATTQPAEQRELVLERRSEVTEVGPPAPAATAPAGPASPPAEGVTPPPAGDGAGDAPPNPDAAAAPAPAPDAPKAGDPAPAEPNVEAPPRPTDAPKSEPQPAPPPPQSRVISPDGGGVVTFAAFQDQPTPAESKPEAPKPTDAAPAASAASPAPAEPQSSSTAGEKAMKDDAGTPEPMQSVQDAVAAVTGRWSGAEVRETGAQSVRDAVAAVTGQATAATQPMTSPATPAATQPAAPRSKWLIASEPKGDANDAHVQALVAALRPLRAQKYLETFPTTQAAPAGTYVLKVSTRPWGEEPAKEHEIKITDPGGQAPLIAQSGGLVFELDRAFLEKLTADFTEANVAEPPGPPGGPEDMPADLLRQFGAPPGPPPGQ